MCRLILPPHASDESRRRLALAEVVAESCPSALGREIAVTGSVALGLADGTSDVEMNLWVDELPSVEARTEWIAAIGGTEAAVRAGPWADGTLEATFLYRGVWIEAGWMTRARLEQTLAELLTGEVLGHDRLVMAWTLERAIVLRSGGELAAWRSRLRSYPEILSERLIEANTRVWGMPHAMLGRWTYCRRNQPLALTERLTWDTYNLIRVLFALNRRWEPDWKWLREVTTDLAIAPERLAERIERVFTAPTLEERVRTDLELIRDALALLPDVANVLKARLSVARALSARP